MPSTNKGNTLQKVVIIGPAHPLRGGLASFDERLARQFMQDGYDTCIYTFSLQYPGFLFPGTTQYSSEPVPADLNIKVCINSINPFNWINIGLRLRKYKPDIIVVRFWLPFMGPCLSTVVRIAKTNRYSRTVCIADNVIPHEKRPGDRLFTSYFLPAFNAFVTMSAKVLEDLKTFTKKPARQIVHPLYDNFGVAYPIREARRKLGLKEDEKIILFFGFIRKYKGLDLLLEAMQDIRIKALGIKLLVAGEFYEDRVPYDAQIAALGIEEQLILRTNFISDSEVADYLSAADFVIQPYRNATQSGVTPLAYHFEKPMLVTNVGGLPDLVPDGKAGLIAAPDPHSIASQIIHLYELGAEHFLPQLREEKKKYSWKILTDTIVELSSI